MLRISCPCCGPRPHDEFRYGGDATAERPGPDDPDAERWFRYVFQRSNPKGLHREFWQHAMGCRRWLVAERDTGTHTITSVVLAKQSRTP